VNKLLRNILRWIGWLITVYLIPGLTYYFSGVIYRNIIGKAEVFSPIVGLPLTLFGWPWMVYADFIHRKTLGLKPPFILGILTLLVMMIVLGIKAAREFRQK
jgi:hypothetical protein